MLISSGPSKNSLLDGLRAYWNLNDDGSGNVSLVDSTGNGNTLTNTGSVILSSGITGSAASFVNTPSHLAVSLASNYNNFTFSCWVKGGLQDQPYPEIVCGNANNPGWEITFGHFPETSTQLHSFFDGTGIIGITNIADTNWHHVAATYDGNTYKLFCDGKLEGTITTTAVVNMRDITIGGSSDNNSQLQFIGLIDEIGFWNRALTSNEVFNLYYQGTSNTYPFNKSLITPQLTDNLLAYWKMNEASGTRYDSVSGLQIVETNGTVGRTSGIVENAANITDGDSAWLTLPAGICDIGSIAKSFSMWFYLTQTGVGYQWIGPMQGTGGDYTEALIMYIESGGNLNCTFTTSAGSWTNYHSYTGSSAPAANTWHHAVAVFTGTECILYFNGVEASRQSYSGPVVSSGGSYTLGEYNPYNPNPDTTGGPSFNGRVGELGIWNRVLTQEDVKKIYNSGRGDTYPFQSHPLIDGLQAYWNLNDSSWSDSTGNGFTLTNNNNGITNTAGIVSDGALGDGSSWLSTSSTINLSGNFTINYWTNCTTNGQCFAGEPGVGIGFNFSTDNGGNFNYGLTEISVNLTVSFAQKPGYRMATLVRLNGNVTIYVDGIALGTYNNDTTDYTSNIGLFAQSTGGHVGDSTGLKLDEVGVWNRALTQDEINVLFYNGTANTYSFSKPPVTQSLTNNLLAYWDLDDDGTGNVKLTDATGNGYTLTNNGGVKSVPGILNKGAQFDSSNMLYIDNFPALASAPFTVSYWANYVYEGSIPRDPVPGLVGQWGDSSASGPYSWGIYEDSSYPDSNSKLNLLWSANGYGLDNRMTTNLSFADGTWRHYVLVYDGINALLYVDGKQVYHNAVGFPVYNSVQTFVIGWQNGIGLRGSMDEVGVWTRILSPYEINTLYRFKSPYNVATIPTLAIDNAKPVFPLESIAAYWSFDNTSWNDSTGNGHNLVAPNGIAGVGITSGVIDNAVKFNGDSTTYLTTSDSFLNGNVKAQLSFGGWVKSINPVFFINDVTGNNWGGGIIDMSTNGDGTASATVWWGSDSNSSFDRVTAGTNTNDGKWHHIFYTWNQYGYGTLYIDGIQVGQTIAAGYPVNVGANNISFNSNGDGTYNTGQNCDIDECGIWLRELTAKEVSDLYNGGKGLAYPDTTSTQLTDSIKAYWSLDNDGSGNVSLVDSTGNGFTLTNNGGVALGAGLSGGGASFDYTADQSLANYDISIVGDYTVSCWIKFNSLNSGNGYPALWQTAATGGTYVNPSSTPDGNVSYFDATLGGGPAGLYNYHIGTGNWDHYALVVTNGVVTTYYNGQINSISITNSNYDFVGFLIGRGGAMNVPDATMDEVGIWNRALSQKEIQELYYSGEGNPYPFTKPVVVQPAVVQPLLTDDIQAYWKLDELSYGTAAVTRIDATGNGYNLTDSGTVKSSSGIIKNSAAFDGYNGLTIPAADYPDLNNIFSCSCWIKTTTQQEFLGAWQNGGQFVINTADHPFYDGTFGVSLFNLDGISDNLTSTVYAADNNWHHVVLTLDGAVATLYVDGKYQSSRLYTYNDYDAITKRDFFVGSVDQIYGFQWDGLLDEIGLWTRALTFDEVTRLYNNGKGLTYPFLKPAAKLITKKTPTIITNNLVLNLDASNKASYSGTGGVWYDISGNNYTASLVNTPTYSADNGGIFLMDGSAQYIINNEDLAGNFNTTDTSMFVWIYPTSAGQIVSELGQYATNTGWHDANIEIDSGGTISFSTWPINAVVTATTTLSAWHYVGWTLTGTTLTAYIDGAIAGTTTLTRTAPYQGGNGLYYGICAADSTSLGTAYGNMGGKIGAFHLYSSGLTSDEVHHNYNATKKRFGL